MIELNKEILIYLNSLIQYNFIENTTLYFSDTPIYFLPIFLLLVWVFFTYKKEDNKRKSDLLFIFYSTVIALIINLIIQQFTTLDRPESALE